MPSGEYTVTAIVLDTAGQIIGAPLVVGRVGYQAADRIFEMPPIETPFAADFGGILALRGYGLRQEVEALYLDVVWSAVADPPADYKSFVHLYDPATGEIATQVDSMPRAFTYPTSHWSAGEFVTETLTLDLGGIPPSDYRLGIGWYNPTTGDRLAASGPDQPTWPDDRVTLDEVITIP